MSQSPLDTAAVAASQVDIFSEHQIDNAVASSDCLSYSSSNLANLQRLLFASSPHPSTKNMTSSLGPLSPSSSPRLPSPPPFPEVQIGLKSPTMGAISPGLSSTGVPLPDLTDAAKLDNGATRRIRPGTKAADMASGPPLVPLADVSFYFSFDT